MSCETNALAVQIMFKSSTTLAPIGTRKMADVGRSYLGIVSEVSKILLSLLNGFTISHSVDKY